MAKLIPEFLDLFGARCAFVLILGLPSQGFLIGFGQLAFQIETGLGLLFQLHANRFQFDFQRVNAALQCRAALLKINRR